MGRGSAGRCAVTTTSIAKTKTGYMTWRAWRVGPDRVIHIGLPCDADGCITMTPAMFDRLRRYVDLLKQEVAIAEEARADKSEGVDDATPPQDE